MWRFASAQLIGSAHQKLGTPCQDRLRSVVLQNNTLVAVIADGAGSSKMAETGAQTAVDVVIQSVSDGVLSGRTDFSTLLVEAAAQAREQVMATASEHGLEPREFASTLLAVVISPAGGAAFQIGDGVIVVSDGDDDHSWVFWPQRGEYANTTHFLTDKNMVSFQQVESFTGSIMDVALMSDGLESLALHFASKSIYQPFCKGMFDPLRRKDGTGEISFLSNELEKFLGSERVRSRTDDDISLILATRRPRLQVSP